jgi:cytoskeletal protein CcmA (bactofilin family)
MFKKTEETEWTRFSKALSSREREEMEAADDEGASPAPAAPAAPARAEAPAPPPTRQMASDVNVSARAATRPAPQVGEDDIESTIGEHTTVDGIFRSENSIRIRGTVQGEIESQRSILVEEEANVTAKVTAAAVTVAGQVNGQIYCSGRVELRPSGRVMGEINAGTLIMQEGAFFEGNLKMGNSASQISTPEGEKAGAAR